MTRVLIAPALFTGHLFPHLAIASELRRRGHDVVVLGEPAAAPFVEQTGCRFTAVPVGDLARGFGSIASEADVVAAFAAVAAAAAPAMLAALDHHAVDVIVSDTFHLGAALAAHRSGLPHVTLATTPFESDAGFGASPIRAVPTDELRRSLGLLPSRDDAYVQSLSCSLTLLPWPREFDGGAFPAPSRWIGPLAWDPPAIAGAPEPRGDRPVVLVTTSTAAVDSLRDDIVAYLESAIEALGDLPVEAIVTAGELWPADRALPDNVQVVRFLSHAAVMPRVRVMVSHGGWGSLSRALVHGVPAVVVPFAIDQPRNAERAEAIGVGVYLPVELLAPEPLYNAIRELLEDDSPQRARAEQIAAACRRAPPAATAADQILAVATLASASHR